MATAITFEEFKKSCINQGLSGRAQIIDVFIAAINAYKEKLLLLTPDQLDTTNLEKIISDSFDWILISSFLEDNIEAYDTKATTQEINLYRNEGLILTTQEEYESQNIFPDKTLHLQLTLTDQEVNNDPVVRVDFNLLDNMHHHWDNEKDDNVASLLDVMDRHQFMYQNVDIKNQVIKADKLFAIISIEDTSYNICEYATAWLLATGWNYSFLYANQEVRKFYSENKLDYHFSYCTSIDNLYFGIREANTQIHNTFEQIVESKHHFDALVVAELEHDNQPFYRKMFYSKSKLNKDIAKDKEFLLNKNQDIILSCWHKLDFLRKEIVLVGMRDKTIK